MVVCEFCKKEYSNIHILNNHQKTANFCIKIQNSIKNSIDKKNENINISILICEFCKKEFNTKFKLISHSGNCKHKELKNELDQVKKELEEVKKENEVKLELLKKENKIKDDYIQTLKNQINVYIEKTTSNNSVGNNNNTSIVNNIVNTVNIKEEEFNKLFASIKPMIPKDIKRSMQYILHEPMVNNVESMDKYFIKSFVEHFKDYMFTTDGSRGTIIIKLENGDSDKIKAVQFIIDCFKIAQPELKRLFVEVQRYLKVLSDANEITAEEYAMYKVNLKDLVDFVFEKKSNKLVNKIASELVKRGKIVKNKRLTDNKVLENEILGLN